MNDQEIPQVLVATFIERIEKQSKHSKFLFYYRITGNKEWLSKFAEQKKEYVNLNEKDELVFSVPWYFGKVCPVCVNKFNDKLFLNINEHMAIATKVKQANMFPKQGNYKSWWDQLAESENDANWLTKNNE